jgi:DNA-directed RNA polymerase specialized sigma subunit
MPLDELDIHQIINRLDKIERVDLDERLGYIEKQMKHFAFAAASIATDFKRGIAVRVDKDSVDYSKDVANAMQKLVACYRYEVNQIMEFRKHITEVFKQESITGPLKFMAKQLQELTFAVNEIKANGIKKNIHLDLTMDGYEMVKRKSPKINIDIEEEDKKTPEQTIRDLLSTLLPRESLVLMHRFGLLGEKKKTLDTTGKALDISRERVRQIELKAIRKCRHPSRRFACEDLTHLELRKAIIGE